MIIELNSEMEVITPNTKNKVVKETKNVKFIPTDIYKNIYIYKNGNFIKIAPIDFKKNKLAELETYITNIRSQGVEYKDQLWSIDEECEKNLTSQITLLSFAPTEKVAWFSKTQVNELTINEFKELALVLSNAISQAKLKYYEYKNAIETATTEEEINAIIFE